MALTGKFGSLYIKTGGENVNTEFFAPAGDATWTKYTSGVEATLALATEDAGFIDIDLPGITAGAAVITAVRVPVYLRT